MKRVLFFVSFIFLIVLASFSFVGAFGVGAFYSKDIPLEMYPGQEIDTPFLVQNFLSSEEQSIFVEVSLISGAEIAGFTDSVLEYEIPFEGEIEININIIVPADAKVGESYDIVALFRPSASTNSGENVQFVTNIGRSFPVIVVEKPVEAPAFDDLEIPVEEASDFLVSSLIWIVVVFVFLVGIVIVGIILVRSIRRVSLNNI